jgi:acyl-CoA thioester hydrolase
MPASDRSLLTRSTFRVRYAETDQMGVVHHAAYVVYLEQGRSDLMRLHGAPYPDLEAAGLSLAVSEITVRYHASACYDEEVTVETWLERLQSRGVTLAYRVVDTATGRELVTATTRLICVDHQGHVQRIPTDWAKPLADALSDHPPRVQ